MIWVLMSCGSPPDEMDPGAVTLRRLNRAEYDNTVRDLFGTALRPARDFPADDFGLGFDNIGSVLSVSPLHVELYDRAADSLLDELFSFGTLPPAEWTLEAESGFWDADNGNVWDVTRWILWDEGAMTTPIWAADAGDYSITVEAAGQQAGEAPVQMGIVVDGGTVATFDVPTDVDAPYTARVPLTAGEHHVGVSFLNEFESPTEGLDRNLLVNRVRVAGPLDVPRPVAPGRDRVLTCDPSVAGEPACAEQVVRGFGRRAFRRPLTEAEVADVMGAYAAVRAVDGSWDEGVRASLKRILLSPSFLYLVELDPADGPRELTGFELAARLSYFLWSSTPDDRLLDLAQSGAITDPAVLEAETRRLLADPRSDALIDNLAGQWLGVRKVEVAAPNLELFPEWDATLKASMEEEVARFVRSVLRADRPLQDLLLSEDTFVDARLAAHYGVAPPAGEGMQPARVPGRAGLLSRGGLLAALAYPTRTSPVVRGNWVLSNLLCSPPPPPPGGIPPLPDAGEEPMSLRETLELHRSNPACAVCHDQMDAIGLALEEYDAIGRYRQIDEFGLPIDSTGSIDGLGAFADAEEMQRLIAGDGRFARCAVTKTFTYALGRGPTDSDQLLIDSMTVRFAAEGYRFEDLVVQTVLSRPFRWRTGDAP